MTTPQVADPLAGVSPTSVRFQVLGWFCALSMITYIDRVCIMQVQVPMMFDLGLVKQSEKTPPKTSPGSEPSYWDLRAASLANAVAEFEPDTTSFAWAFFAFALAYALFEVPSGWLGDKFGPRKVLIRIVLCWLLFTAMTGLVIGLASLIIVRLLFGAGEAGAYPNMARAARNWFPFQERGRAQGMIWLFGRWGGAVAPILILALTAPFDALGLPGWRFAFVLLGLLGVAWVFGFARWYHDGPRQHPKVNEAEAAYIEQGGNSSDKPAPLSWHNMLHSRTLWALSFMYFCSNAGWSFFITFVPLYLKEAGVEGWQLALVSGLPLLCGGVGCLLGGFLTDRQVRVWGKRWGRTAQGVAAYALGGLFFVIAGLLTKSQPIKAIVFICLASFVKDFAMGASWATTIDIGHRYSGTVAGLMNTVGNLGTVFMAPLIAYLVADLPKDSRWAASLPFYATMFFIAAGMWFFINPRKVIVYSPEDQVKLKEQGILE